MTPDRQRGSDARDLRERIAELEQATGSPVPADMTPSEFANAYLAGDLGISVPDDDLSEPRDRPGVGPTDADDTNDEWAYLRCFGTEEENIGGITVPRAAIPDCFDPEEDFPV